MQRRRDWGPRCAYYPRNTTKQDKRTKQGSQVSCLVQFCKWVKQWVPYAEIEQLSRLTSPSLRVVLAVLNECLELFLGVLYEIAARDTCAGIGYRLWGQFITTYAL